MRTNSTYPNRASLGFIMALLSMCCLTFNLFAQVHKTFTPRTSSQSLAPYTGQSIYHLRGDFTMIGNTNVTLTDYFENGDKSSNNNPMKFKDVDGDNRTVNSSKAKLNLSGSNDIDPNCSKVVFAGLYWSGRAAREVTNGNSIKFLDNNLVVSEQGSNNNKYVRYKFGNTELEFTNNNNNPGVRKRNNSNSTTSLQVTVESFTSGGTNYLIATFNEPYVIYDNSSHAKIVVHSLTRRSSNSSSNNNSITSGAVALIETLPYANGTLLDKKKVKLKLPGNNNYTTINALSNGIYYGKREAGYMYAGFADVTALVRDNSNGANGHYTVADIASSIGAADGTGYYGGWGMVIVYENAKMPWRDVTMFDGLAYVVGNTVTSHELSVSGFKAVENTGINQQIKVKMGMMAGEGDRNIAGDYFKIRNAANNGWISLSHNKNTSDNFFNSSVNIGNNTRDPDLVNNTGLDIVMFDLPNSDRSIIDYGQTSTKFQYGSTQDTYIIYNIIFAVDAYIPEIEGLSKLVKVNETSAQPGNQTVNAGDFLTYEVEIRNRGTEPLKNAVLEVPLPYLASFVSASAEWVYAGTPGGTFAHPTFNPSLGSNGKILWKIGDMPLPSHPSDKIGKLKFKIKVADDCRFLNVSNCIPKLSVNGKVTGIGKLSGVSVESSFITGYEQGSCVGGVIRDPQIITINADCTEPPTEKKFTFCNLSTPSISFWDIAGSFEEGTRFYTLDGQEEINSQDGFPNTNSKYIAIPRGGEFGDGNCYFEFSVIISVITESPSLIDGGEITYCLNDEAVALTATPTSNEYNLYYYYANDLSTAYSEIIPSTLNAGEVTYYVAQGTNTCIGPKAEIIVEVGTCNLPVTLVSLNAVAGDQGVIVNWVTTEEINTAYFDIERSLDPREGFKKIGTTSAKGVFEGGKYSFQDITTAKGQINYYRLKMVDLDKSYTYSQIINAELSGEVDAQVYPNPVADELSVSSSSAIASLEIINLSGQTVSQNNFSGNKTKEMIKVNTLMPGTYLVKISTSSGAVYFRKLVKKN